MYKLKLYLAIAVLFSGVAIAVAQSDVPQPLQSQNEKILRIISNPVIWRKDFPSVLATLKDWNQTGEVKVAVYADQAVGSRKFNLDTVEALKEASELHLLMSQGKSELKPDLRAMLNTTWNAPLTTLSPAAQPARDEISATVVLTQKTETPAELFSRGLTIATVRDQTGEPESITTQVIDTGSERRPVILTLYHYAGDAIVFAVSDMSPDVIDRAFLDTRKISEAIFRNPN